MSLTSLSRSISSVPNFVTTMRPIGVAALVLLLPELRCVGRFERRNIAPAIPTPPSADCVHNEWTFGFYCVPRSWQTSKYRIRNSPAGSNLCGGHRRARILSCCPDTHEYGVDQHTLVRQLRNR